MYLTSFFFVPGHCELLVILAILALTVLTVLPFWVIFRKAGFPPALSVLMVVPWINLAVLFFLAFAKWPALEQRRQEDERTAGR